MHYAHVSSGSFSRKLLKAATEDKSDAVGLRVDEHKFWNKEGAA